MMEPEGGHRNSSTIQHKLSITINGSNLSSVPAIRYGIDNEEIGIDNEEIAIKQLEKQENISIQSCGLFVDQEHAFLGTTPDGKYADGLIEIKCPSSLANLVLDDAMKKHPFWKRDSTSNSYLINKTHDWYFQIQGQLHVTKEDVCMLGIWFGEAVLMKVYLIQRGDEFWKAKMEPKLVAFYYDFLLPELVDPRNSRCMQIRDPPNVIRAMEEKKKRMKKRMNQWRESKDLLG